MPRHFKIHDELPAEELALLEEFARDKRRTVTDCHEWLLAKGYTLSRSAVGTWKKAFDATDQFRASNEVARGIMDAAKQGGTVALTDAASLQISQMVFEQMLRLQSEGDVSTKELWALSMSLKNVVQGKRHVEKLKTEVADALAAAEKDAKAGGSAEAVVSKVRQILGIGATQ